jgi:hypothetical protein
MQEKKERDMMSASRVLITRATKAESTFNEDSETLDVLLYFRFAFIA